MYGAHPLLLEHRLMHMLHLPQHLRIRVVQDRVITGLGRKPVKQCTAIHCSHELLSEVFAILDE